MSIWTPLDTDVEFSFGDDGRCALTYTYRNAYPTSSARDDPYVPRTPPSTWSTPAPPTRAYDKYPIPDLREVCPGVLASGQLTDNHPLVDTYINALARLIPREPKTKPLATSSTSSPESPVPQFSHTDPTTVPQHKPFELTYWVAHHAGIASTLTVDNVISQQFQLFPSPVARMFAVEIPKLSQGQKEAIFTLAALKVMNHPTHTAHFAFWGKNILARTAQVVNSVIRLRPCPIVSNVGWMGIPENTWLLAGLQSNFIPPPVAPQKTAGNMTLRKRKAAAANINQEASPAVPQKRARTTRASNKATKAAQTRAAQAARAAAAAAQDTSAEPEAASQLSLLFPSGVAAPDALPMDAPAATVSIDMKQEFMATTPVLQAIELHLKQHSIPLDDLPPPIESPLPTTSSASPIATRRSTRPRKKPAPPGPCSFVSTPVSVITSPPLPSETLGEVPENQLKNGSGSRGSSTAVSDEGYPSEEGTVVAELEISQKRKAVDEDVDELEPEANAPVQVKTASKRKAKKARAPKRAKVEAQAQEPAPAVLEVVENVPAVAVAAPKKRKTATGKRKAARK